MDSLISLLSSAFKHIIPFIDVGIVFLVAYSIYKAMVDTTAIPVIKGFSIILFLYVVAYLLKLNTLLWLLNTSIQSLIIVAFISIQPQIKKLLIDLGNFSFLGTHNSYSKDNFNIDEIIMSCRYLSSKKRGSLIIFERENSLKSIIDNGVKIDSIITKELINTIFEYNTQLHDGALIIGRNGKIVAASCVLPLSNKNDIKQTFGTRHRAAIGVTENSDCIALVVSEENGAISICYNAKIYYNLTEEEVKNQIYELIKIKEDTKIKKE